MARRLQKKRDNLDDEYTVLTIDQTRQVLSTLISAWFPEGERPSLPVTGAWDSIKLLGAVSDGGETFFLPCAENFNSDTTIRLLDALQTEFGEKICVVLDNASYFTANAVQEFAEGTPIELCYLPRGSPELNPAEECWRQLDQELGNRLFDTLDDLRDAALSALDRIKIPDVLRIYVREYKPRASNYVDGWICAMGMGCLHVGAIQIIVCHLISIVASAVVTMPENTERYRSKYS